MCDFETLRARIVPIPKQMELTKGSTLKVTNFSKFCLEIPQAEYGPFVGAREKLTRFLTANCGGDCFHRDGIKITVTKGARPEGVKDIPGGYQLTVNSDGARIVGFDPVGCLYGIVTLTQLLKFDSDCAEVPALSILDWPENNLRGIKEESRYGSNVMQEQDWLGLVDELVNYNSGIYAELICDSRGIHVDPYMLRLVRKIKGDDRIILVSDRSYADAPNPPGYEHVTDINFDKWGDIAGSKLTLEVACRNWMKHTGASIVDAFRVGAYVPARAVGFTDRGEIREGLKADVVLVDEKMNVKTVILNGNICKF